jgi:hypothetical protein
MITDEDVVRDLLTEAAPEFEALDGARLREGRRARSRVRRALPMLAAAAVVAVIAVVVVGTRHDPAKHPLSEQSVGGITVGPEHPGLARFRLELVLNSTRAPADGTPIHGVVLAINNTGHSIAIADAQCNAWVQAGLSGPHVRFGVFSNDVACFPAYRLPVGVTRIPVTIETTYNDCRQGKQPGTPDVPHCLPQNPIIPPLPPGRYDVVVGTQNVTPAPALPRVVAITLLPT